MEYEGGLSRAAAEFFARACAAVGPTPDPETLMQLDALLLALDARRASEPDLTKKPLRALERHPIKKNRYRSENPAGPSEAAIPFDRMAL